MGAIAGVALVREFSDEPPGYDLSSPAVEIPLRRSIYRWRNSQELVTKEVRKIMSVNGKLPWNSITDFHKEGYEFLSNFFEARVEYGGLAYRTNEAAFQAQKCMTEEEKVQFTEYGPGKSKSAGHRVRRSF